MGAVHLLGLSISGGRLGTRTLNASLRNGFQDRPTTNYHRSLHLERHTRIELALSAWKTDVLPLHQWRIWWGIRDSNPYILRHVVLSHACLPVSSIPHIWSHRSDSNRHQLLGGQVCYLYTNTASWQGWVGSNHRNVRVKV